MTNLWNRPWILSCFSVCLVKKRSLVYLIGLNFHQPCFLAFFFCNSRVYTLSGDGSPWGDAPCQGRTPTGAAEPLPAGILPANVALLAFGSAETAGFWRTQSRARPTAGRRRRLHRPGQFPRVHLRAARIAQRRKRKSLSHFLVRHRQKKKQKQKQNKNKIPCVVPAPLSIAHSSTSAHYSQLYNKGAQAILRPDLVEDLNFS